jgi:hypothetical protein
VKRLRGAKRALAILGAAGLAAVGSCADDRPYLLRSVDLIHETFFIATPAWRGFAHRGSWTEVKARLDDHWSGTITNYQLRDRNLLDETYVEYENAANLVRVGKMRGVFGQGRWTDLFYNVVSRYPIIRSAPLLDRFSLLSFNSGVEWHGYHGSWELGVQLADAQLADRQLLPQKHNVAQGRLQATVGGGQVGASVVKVEAGPFGSAGEVFGLDYRWIANRVQVRAELVGSRGSGLTSKGYFADLSYRLPGNHRTQVGVRLEEYAMGSTYARMMTGGIRFVPMPQLAISLNYGWSPSFGMLSGDGGQPPAPFQRGIADTLKGWSLQTMLAFRFKS